jgi:hypothetical protein
MVALSPSNQPPQRDFPTNTNNHQDESPRLCDEYVNCPQE